MTPAPVAMLPAEQARRLAGLAEVGTVAEVDLAQARARVRIGDKLSAWLPWLAARAGGARSWHPPTVGEQVLVSCPGGSLAAGIIVGALYRTAHPAPDAEADAHITAYPDGARVEYRPAASAMAITLPAGGTLAITAAGGCTITGDVAVFGDVLVSGRIGAKGIDLGANLEEGSGAMTIAGPIQQTAGGYTTTGEVTAAAGLASGADVTAAGAVRDGSGTTLGTHTHAGITPGGANTAAPNPGT